MRSASLATRVNPLKRAAFHALAEQIGRTPSALLEQLVDDLLLQVWHARGQPAEADGDSPGVKSDRYARTREGSGRGRGDDDK